MDACMHSLNLVILERSNLRCHLQKSFPVGVILLSGPGYSSASSGRKPTPTRPAIELSWKGRALGTCCWELNFLVGKNGTASEQEHKHEHPEAMAMPITRKSMEGGMSYLAVRWMKG